MHAGAMNGAARASRGDDLIRRKVRKVRGLVRVLVRVLVLVRTRIQGRVVGLALALVFGTRVRASASISTCVVLVA